MSSPIAVTRLTLGTLTGIALCAIASAGTSLGPVRTEPQQWIPNREVGAYTAVNNAWGSTALPEGWRLAVGLGKSPMAPQAVDARFTWKYPQKYPNKDVLAYPQVAFGRAHGFSTSTTAFLPRKVAETSTLSSRYARVSGAVTGLGQLTYDLWITSKPGDPAQHKAVEVMLPTMSYGGYGVPDYPVAATMGRKGLRAGRNPHIYQGRDAIDGQTYDVYHGAPHSPHWPNPWAFIVLQPVDMPDRGAHSVNWGAVLRYLVDKGWISGDQYLSSVELGVEVINSPSGTEGDVEVIGFQIQQSAP